MSKLTTSTPVENQPRWLYVCVVTFLILTLGFLFRKSFNSDYVVFANDGPFGAHVAQAAQMPEALTGIWQDLNWLGLWQGSASPNATYGLLYLLGPVNYHKFYTPLTMLILGLCAGFFFRCLKFHPMVCVLGATAAALNSDFFSYACWGLGSLNITLAVIFLALAALVTSWGRHSWIKILLAGMAVGMGIMEGYDVGAIMSLYVAAFVIFLAFNQGSGRPRDKALQGIIRLFVIVVFAALIAAQAIAFLIPTQLKDKSTTDNVEQTPEEKWAWATQWSLPKKEAVRSIIPGLFGYRMDTPEGGNYWGAVGQQPGNPRNRHSGAGHYAGVLVALLALFALVQSARGPSSPFSPNQKRMIWFWAIAALLSLLFAFGKHGGFTGPRDGASEALPLVIYRFIYALPFFSNIRNPIKFLHPMSLSLVILFAYGLQALAQTYLAQTRDKALSLGDQWREWRKSWSPFEQKWTIGCGVAAGMSVFAWIIYASSKAELKSYLKSILALNPSLNGAEQVAALEAAAEQIAAFSAQELGLFALLLLLSVSLITLIMCGAFNARRSTGAWIALTLLMTIDLGRANRPWVQYENYKLQYARDPIIDILKTNAHEARVTIVPYNLPNPVLPFFNEHIYRTQWMQRKFRYYNIQCLDMIQRPRTPKDYLAFHQALQESIPRLWQLTNTRYLLGLANMAESLNNTFDPLERCFREHTLFTFFGADRAGNVVYNQSPDGTFQSIVTTNGPLALIEFTGALPRAKLYSNWIVEADDAPSLRQLANPGFDPHKRVLVANAIPAATVDPNAKAALQIDRYTPKKITLSTEATAPTVLLLNHNHDPNWTVRVDGKPVEFGLLRCNYLMQGAYLPAGKHEVVFRFEPPTKGLYVSLSVIALGLGFCLYLGLGRNKLPPSLPNASKATED